MKAGNTGGHLLPYWKIVCNDKNNSGRIQNFIKSTKKAVPQVTPEQHHYHRSVLRLCVYVYIDKFQQPW